MHVATKLVLVWLLGMGGALAADASATTPGGVFVRCSFQMLDPAIGYKPQGTYRGGFAKCTKPLGEGKFSGTYHDGVAPEWPMLAETGRSKLRFKRGTVNGTYRFSGSYDVGRYTGAMEISGGTGRFKNASGMLKLKCTKGPPNAHCTGSGTLAGI
jgi:hypothetical protein